MKLGFIGLGVMGAPMAAHLVAAGHDVSGYDVTPAAGEKLQAAGGRAATGVADAVAGADVVITMLPNHPHVEEVVLAAGGVLDTAEPGTLLIDMSTIRPETSIARTRHPTARPGRAAGACRSPRRARRATPHASDRAALGARATRTHGRRRGRLRGSRAAPPRKELGHRAVPRFGFGQLRPAGLRQLVIAPARAIGPPRGLVRLPARVDIALRFEPP